MPIQILQSFDRDDFYSFFQDDEVNDRLNELNIASAKSAWKKNDQLKKPQLIRGDVLQNRIKKNVLNVESGDESSSAPETSPSSIKALAHQYGHQWSTLIVTSPKSPTRLPFYKRSYVGRNDEGNEQEEENNNNDEDTRPAFYYRKPKMLQSTMLMKPRPPKTDSPPPLLANRSTEKGKIRSPSVSNLRPSSSPSSSPCSSPSSLPIYPPGNLLVGRSKIRKGPDVLPEGVTREILSRYLSERRRGTAATGGVDSQPVERRIGESGGEVNGREGNRGHRRDISIGNIHHATSSNGIYKRPSATNAISLSMKKIAGFLNGNPKSCRDNLHHRNDLHHRAATASNGVALIEEEEDSILNDDVTLNEDISLRSLAHLDSLNRTWDDGGGGGAREEWQLERRGGDGSSSSSRDQYSDPNYRRDHRDRNTHFLGHRRDGHSNHMTSSSMANGNMSNGIRNSGTFRSSASSSPVSSSPVSSSNPPPKMTREDWMRWANERGNAKGREAAMKIQNGSQEILPSPHLPNQEGARHLLFNKRYPSKQLLPIQKADPKTRMNPDHKDYKDSSSASTKSKRKKRYEEDDDEGEESEEEYDDDDDDNDNRSHLFPLLSSPSSPHSRAKEMAGFTRISNKIKSGKSISNTVKSSMKNKSVDFQADDAGLSDADAIKVERKAMATAAIARRRSDVDPSREACGFGSTNGDEKREGGRREMNAWSREKGRDRKPKVIIPPEFMDIYRRKYEARKALDVAQRLVRRLPIDMERLEGIRNSIDLSTGGSESSTPSGHMSSSFKGGVKKRFGIQVR